MSNRDFAVLCDNCVVKLVSSESSVREIELQQQIGGKPKVRHDDNSQPLQLTKGMMVEIKDFVAKSSPTSKYCTIKLIDYHRKNLAYENNLYLCKQSCLFRVSPVIWPYLISIMDPFERLEFARDKPHTDYIRSLDINSLVLVDGSIFKLSPISESLNFSNNFIDEDSSSNNYSSGKSTVYECTVLYIGLVPELSPGYFFGLQLLVIFYFIYNFSRC